LSGVVCCAAGALLSPAAPPEGPNLSSRSPDASITPQPGLEADPVVVVRVSERLITEAFAQSVNAATDVQETVLGVPFTGQAVSSGNISLRLAPDHSHAAFAFTVEGASVSEAVGYQGPAIIHGASRTTFSATKILLLDADRGFVGLPTRLVADTTSGVQAIESTAPGIRRCLVGRMAWRRAWATQCEANQIVSHNAERRILSAVEARADQFIADLNQRLYVIEPAFQLVRDDAHYVFHLSTTKSYLQMAVRDVQASGLPDVPAVGVSPYVVQVWLHPSLVQNKGTLDPDAVRIGKAIREGVEKSIRIALTGSARTERIPMEFQFLGPWAVFSVTLEPDQIRLVAE
jgi:hypothetical protein